MQWLLGRSVPKSWRLGWNRLCLLAKLMWFRRLLLLCTGRLTYLYSGPRNLLAHCLFRRWWPGTWDGSSIRWTSWPGEWVICTFFLLIRLVSGRLRSLSCCRDCRWWRTAFSRCPGCGSRRLFRCDTIYLIKI